jgi:hypothetical protein
MKFADVIELMQVRLERTCIFVREWHKFVDLIMLLNCATM